MARPRNDLKELGAVGLERYAGTIYEEFLPELRGLRGRKLIRQMTDNDATIGSLLFAIEMLTRQVTWDVMPATSSPEDEQVADFIRGALFDDMSYSWPDTLSEILSFLPWGWSYFEIVYKVRDGQTTMSQRRSRFTDGRIGWRKWALRSQESLDRWEFDESGGIKGLWQQPAPDFRAAFIPIEKALLFRTTSRKGNPEGLSILRRAYASWYFKSNIQRIEGIGIERDLAGLPVAYVPPELLSTEASTNEQAVLAAIKEIVTNIRRDEQEGVVFPLTYDDSGKERYRLELLNTGGARQFDTDKIITRYDQRILMAVLADFLLLGHEKVGSFALSNNKTSLFSVALGAWLDSICETINRFAIPRLLTLNSIPLEAAPKLTHGDIEEWSLTELADYVQKLSAVGVPFNSPEVMTHFYEKAKLPVPAEGFELRDASEADTETSAESAPDTADTASDPAEDQ